jgi:hypothetical protein
MQVRCSGYAGSQFGRGALAGVGDNRSEVGSGSAVGSRVGNGAGARVGNAAVVFAARAGGLVARAGGRIAGSEAVSALGATTGTPCATSGS